MKTLVAGVDCSTQETKVLILDPGSGRVLERGRAPTTRLTRPMRSASPAPASREISAS